MTNEGSYPAALHAGAQRLNIALSSASSSAGSSLACSGKWMTLRAQRRASNSAVSLMMAALQRQWTPSAKKTVLHGIAKARLCCNGKLHNHLNYEPCKLSTLKVAAQIPPSQPRPHDPPLLQAPIETCAHRHPLCMAITSMFVHVLPMHGASERN